MKKAERIEVRCTDCDNGETYNVIEHVVIVKCKDAPTYASNKGPAFSEEIVRLIQSMDAESLILLDRITLRSASGSETIQLKPISIIPK